MGFPGLNDTMALLGGKHGTYKHTDLYLKMLLLLVSVHTWTKRRVIL